MFIDYSKFKQMFGLRTQTNIGNPRIFRTSVFNLPKYTCHHYIGLGDEDIGPTVKNPLYKDVRTLMPIYTYTEIATRVGSPTVQAIQIVDKLKKHVRDNKDKFRFARELKGISTLPNAPLVMNYALCSKRYKYFGEKVRISYYRQVNILNTLIKGITDVHLQYGNTFNQFLFINLPSIQSFMKVSEMVKASRNMEIKHYGQLGDFDQLVIFELWKLVGLNQTKSVFNTLSPEILDKLNIVFLYNNVFTTVNVGDLLKFRKSKDNPQGEIEPREFSKRFIRSLVQVVMASKNTKLIEKTDDEKIQETLDASDTKGTDDEALTNEEKEELKNEKPLTYRERQVLREEERLNKELASIDNMDESEFDTRDEDDLDDISDLPSASDIQIDDEMDLVSDILDAEDETTTDIVEDTESTLPKVNLKQTTNVTGNEIQVDEFDLNITKTDITDVLKIKDYPVEKKVTLISRSTTPRSPEEKARITLDEVAKHSAMSVSKYDNLRKTSTRYKDIILNKEDGKTLAELIDIKPSDIEISEKDLESGLSTTEIMDKRYIQNIMERDIVSMVVGLQSGGALIQDMSRSELSNASGNSIVYSVKIRPIEGEPSTIRFRIPKLNDSGTFNIGGKAYKLIKQRFDLPIRKIDDSTVSLSSYYGKTFVRRDPLQAFNYAKWLIKKIRSASFDKENTVVLETRSANVFDNTLKVPNVFSILAMEFRAITTDKCYLYLDYRNARKRFGDELVEGCENIGLTFIGIYKKKYALGIDEVNDFYAVTENGKELIGTIETICDLSLKQAPVEAATIDIMSKKIPVGIVLAYRLGLTKLLASLNPKHYRTFPSNTRTPLEPHEFAIEFADYKIALSRRDKLVSLIMAGWEKVNDETRKHSIYLFDKSDIYFSLLESMKVPGRYLKEIDLYYSMFVDPITERILIDMHEPIDFGGLLVRACEMLETRDHSDETDTSYQRLRGYERMTGEIYTQMVRAMRVHNRHGIKANYPIELNPEAVWLGIATDTTKLPEELLNPLQDLKQSQAVTYSGNGGRSRVSLVKRARSYHKNSVGLISEASVDSHDSGNRVFLSANPKLKNIYGVPSSSLGKVNPEELKPENVMSTVAMMTPAIDTDDPKRILFASTQSVHTIPSTNYQVMPTRTGYDNELAKACNDQFASIAKVAGTVESVTPFGIVVKNDDGTERHVSLYRQYGSSSGFHMPIDIKTDLKAGDRIEVGDAIAYNPAWFTADPMNPGKLAYRGWGLSKVALMEHPHTFEDSTAISKSFSQKNEVEYTTIKHVVVDFEQSIHRLLKPGTKVGVDEALCIIEDYVTGDTGLFDDESIDLLRNLGAQAPKSPVEGTIDKIEVVYNGDKEDMSESLQKIANISDNILVKKLRASGKPIYLGDVGDGEYSVDGNKLMPDTAVLSFYISTKSKISVGDNIKLTIY